MRFNRITFWRIFLGLSSGLVLVSIFTPLVNRAPLNARRSQCQSNLRQIALAVRQYCADTNGQMPSLQTVAGWRGAIAPYAKKTEIFRCPSVETEAPELSDYWFNARLSGARLIAVGRPATVLMLGDDYSTSDPRVALSNWPAVWRVDDDSPAQRHLGGTNIAFVDGHVKTVRLEPKPRAEPFTFALR